jgi:hypothetical protein
MLLIMINWHRLFGLTLDDYFHGTDFSVELEEDVSRKRQVLDVVVIQTPADGPARPLGEPCDGFEDLRAHNLLTYKSVRQSLDARAIEELIGHGVNYRKAFAPKAPSRDIALFAVATRHPRKLFKQLRPTRVKEGVYRLAGIERPITVIVPNAVKPVPRNALRQLFSAEAERVRAGAAQYRWRDKEHLPILDHLREHYQHLGFAMSYTIEDFHRDAAKAMLPRLTPEERLHGLTPEEILRQLKPEELLRGLDRDKLAQLRALLDAAASKEP